MKRCIVCKDILYSDNRKRQKYCSSVCYEKNRGVLKRCLICQLEFKGREKRKFCSSKCFGLSQRERIIKRNIANKKYPDIEGLSRSQVYLRLRPQTRLNYMVRENKKRFDLILKLGGKCKKCGFDRDIRGLVLDHINGDGLIDRKRIGSRISRYYINHIDEARMKLQVLCATCNQIKSIENKEHNISRRIKE